ncbi:phage tail domain-containing protein [Listeria booriae]|uniref:phage tail domain-containing protein n=1 Tax=Listeria booriae TaxID=1552123 RepID=UPI0016242446|nr:phage tail domain-containing protein [Listeria booriae]MBC1290636.1 hypothetical protein [Listeria booriae]MBC2163413.1 hypothetical protein [Listeria booriae]
MDLLIEKDGNEKRYASELKLFVKDIHVSNATLEQTLTNVKGRAGSIDRGATHGVKTVTLTGILKAASQLEYLHYRDLIYATFSDDEAFYVTEFYNEKDMYEFELPGERQAFSLGNMGVPKFPYRQRYLVRLNNDIAIDFIGASADGLKADVTIELCTTELPFGETKPVNILVKNNRIRYRGSAKCSQLESPFTLKATALNNGTNASFTIGDRTLVFTGTYKINDVFELNGVSNLQNSISINDKTNYQYFIFKPSVQKFINVSCSKPNDFKLEIINFKELFL